MAEAYSVIAQIAPPALALTDFYTVPSSTSAVCSTLIICNRGTSTSYRVSIALGGAADAVEQYIAYDIALSNFAVHAWTIGVTLAAGDVVRVYVNDATVSFNLFGAEIT